MDHFTHTIIRNELLAITSRPPPDPSAWVFSPRNDSLFSAHIAASSDSEKAYDLQHTTPDEWVQKGIAEMQATMADFES